MAVMAPKRSLSDEDVLQILQLHESGMSMAKIAARFDRNSSTIRQILLGETYRHVTGRGHTSTDTCTCRSCAKNRRQEANLDAADNAICEVACMGCGCGVVRKASVVKRTRGLVLCDQCDGRRGK
jgi:IS30 family transposase